FMRLVIEHIGTGPRGGELVSVAHYGEQAGDLMRDPEIVFEVAAGSWHPVSIQQDYVGSYREAGFVGEDGEGYVRFSANALNQGRFEVVPFDQAMALPLSSSSPVRPSSQPWTTNFLASVKRAVANSPSSLTSKRMRPCWKIAHGWSSLPS